MTTTEIYNEIIDEKESGNYPELDELNSTSKVAIWRLWVWIFAFFSNSLNEVFISFKSYINETFAKNQAGTLLWWISNIKKFQDNDSLEFIGGVFKYPIIDETKQIIKQVALESRYPEVIFKVVSEDGSGNLVPISENQVDNLRAYINQIKFPGTYIDVISQLADDLRLNYRIYYNAQLSVSSIETAIREQADSYLSNIVFNGKFSITELTDEFQKITGVVNPMYLSGQAKNHFQNIAEYSEIEDYSNSVAGYMAIDNLTLEFIPDVQY